MMHLDFVNAPTPFHGSDTTCSPTAEPSSNATQRNHADVRHSPKRSANRVKAKAAKPQVISSILDSLQDTLAPLPDVDRNEHFSDTASRFSRAESSRNSVASSASIHRASSTPGFGVEYGNSLELDDEDGVTDAALPPTIPTSRPPSGLSNHTLKKQSVFINRASTTPYLNTAPESRRSSFSASITSSAKNKLSAESWVRKSLTGDDWLEGSRGRKSLPHMGSHDMLRSGKAATSASRAVREKVPTSLAEQIIARTPAASVSKKGRLYLTDDATVDEDPLADSPISIPHFEVHKVLAIDKPWPLASPLEQHLEIVGAAPVKSPSPISDSIPTRTSSLRQPSKSPAPGKRKHKKSKRHTVTPSKSETMSYKRSKPIPDASWADLDEDDETVKRIKELRELRKSRLQESNTYVPTIESTHEENFANAPPVHELVDPQIEQAERVSQQRIRATEPVLEPARAHKMQIWKGESTRLKDLNASQISDTTVPVSEPSDSSKYSMEVKRPISLQPRPVTSRSENSTIQPRSLDYSYAQAIDALNGLESTGGVEAQSTSRTYSERYGQNLTVKSSGRTAIISPRESRYSKRSKRSPEHRWSHQHPDLPLNFEKRKSRRKSMSDARNARAIEEDIQLERRDSIQEAVTAYLDAPRLSRTVKNAATGRKITFSEVGDPEGAAVFVCVGMGLTRYVTAFFDDLAATLRLRLITLDRPGVGGSEPLAASDKSGPLSWPEDVLAVCQSLGIVKFSILAHSAGAIYALATALILPHLVKGKVHLLAPWVPPSQLEAISHPTASAPPANPLPRSQRFLRVLPTPFLKAANSSFMTATSASLKPASKRQVKTRAKSPSRKMPEAATPPKRPVSHDRPEYNRRESMMLMDRFMPSTNPMENFPIAVNGDQAEDADTNRGSLILSATASPMDPGLAYANMGLSAAEHSERERKNEYTSHLTQRTWDLATRDSNPATDLVVCLERTRDVGFRYTDVGREVVIHHGSEDKRVPIANVKWLAEQMNRRALGLNLGLDARESKESWRDPAARGGCEVHVLEGEGHGLMASPSIMGDVLTEIAGYWLGSEDTGHV